MSIHNIQRDFLDACRQRINAYTAARDTHRFHPQGQNTRNADLLPQLNSYKVPTTYIEPDQGSGVPPFTPRHVLERPGAWVHHLHAEDADLVRAVYGQGMAEGGTYDMLVRLIAQDGHIAWMRHRVTFEGDHLHGYLPQTALFVDDTEHHQAREQSQRREFELDLMLDLSQKIEHATTVYDLILALLNHLDSGIDHDISAAMLVNGRSIDLVSQANALVTPGTLHSVDERIFSTFMTLQGGLRDHYHVHLTHRGPLPMTGDAAVEALESLVMVPVFTGEGREVAGMLLVGSEQPHAFDESHIRMLYTMANVAAVSIERLNTLRHAELIRLENLVRNLPDGVLLLDDHHEIVLANPMAQLYLSQIAGDVRLPIERRLNALLRRLPLETHADDEAWHEVVVERGSVYRVFEVAYRRMAIDDGHAGWEIVLRDISIHKQAGRELHRALLRERELVALKSQFVQLVSHEFRTPLATIMLSNDLLQKYDARLPQDKKVTYWERISEAIRHMRHMLDDVSTVNNIDADRFGFNPEHFDLLGLCENLIEEQREMASEEHRLIYAASGSCPRVYMDPQLIRHILNNLMSNAIKYSPEGGTITLKLTCDEKFAILAVSDEGIGIPSRDLPYLFDQFHRAKNVEHIRGTGLGLAIVKTCVETHNGTIQVESQEGVGSTFTVTLPKYNLHPQN